jgi:hypothetical protein
VPFHCSIKVSLPTPPTATQKLGEGQLTAASPACPGIEGADITVHEEPSHCSMSGWGPLLSCPTATQKSALAQESPKKKPWSTVGVVPTVQFDALTVAGTLVADACPVDVALTGALPTRSHAPTRAVSSAGTARRTNDITDRLFPGEHGPAAENASWQAVGFR